MLYRLIAFTVGFACLSLPAHAVITDENIQSALRAIHTDFDGQGFDHGWTTVDDVSGEEVFVDVINCGASRIVCNPEQEITEFSFRAASNSTGSISERIADLQNLISLSISGGYVPTLPDAIGTLSKLETLSVESTRISSLPDTVGNLTQLKSLSLRYSANLRALPATLGNLTQLQTLDCYNCTALRTLPDSVTNLTALTTLDLYYSKLNSLPDNIGNLRQLQTLNIGRTYIKTLPDSFKNLDQLVELNTILNRMTQFPEEIIDLASIERLYMGYHDMTEIPATIGNLTTLKKLTLRGGRLTGLPASLNQLTGLTELYIEHNEFQTFPPVLLELTTLNKLRITGNNIQGEVPAGLLSLSNLNDNDHDPSDPYTHGLSIDYNAMTSDDPSLLTFIEQKTIGGAFHDGQALPIAETSFASYQRENDVATVDIRWSKPEYAGSNGITNGFLIKVKDLRIDDSDFVNFLWIKDLPDEPISWEFDRNFPGSAMTVVSLEVEDDYYEGRFTINTGAEDYAFTIQASHRYYGNSWPTGYEYTLGKAGPTLLMNDVDNDGTINLEDAFIMQPEAALDDDEDGMPDAFAEGCDEACQQASGLTLDPYPDNTSNTPPKKKTGGSTGMLLLMMMGSLLLARQQLISSTPYK